MMLKTGSLRYQEDHSIRTMSDVPFFPTSGDYDGYHTKQRYDDRNTIDISTATPEGLAPIQSESQPAATMRPNCRDEALHATFAERYPSPFRHSRTTIDGFSHREMPRRHQRGDNISIPAVPMRQTHMC